jgi:TPR repeat protein
MSILAVGLGSLTVGCTTTSGPAVSAEKMAELEAQANKGDADAMLKLGDAHTKNKNYTEAKVWYDKAKAAFEAMK